MKFLVVFLGAGTGGMLRHLANVHMVRIGRVEPHVVTLAINIIGSFLIGIVAAQLSDRANHDQLRLFLMPGLLGGFTTFSAFSLDVVALAQRGQVATAAGYVGGSVVLSIAGAVLGVILGGRGA